MEHFDSSLGANTTSDELLKILTDCKEFAEMPVRHNEDLLNAELAKQCPVQLNPYTMDRLVLILGDKMNCTVRLGKQFSGSSPCLPWQQGTGQVQN